MLLLPLDGEGPLHRQLYRSLRGAILGGRLAAGARLPSTRNLARELGLARNTVLLACEQLVAEGYAAPRARSGTFVGGRAAAAPGEWRRRGQASGPSFPRARHRICADRRPAAQNWSPWQAPFPYDSPRRAGLRGSAARHPRLLGGAAPVTRRLAYQAPGATEPRDAAKAPRARGAVCG